MTGLRLAAVFLGLVICTCAPGQVTQPEQTSASTQSANGMPPRAAAGHTLEAHDLEGFFDGIFPLQLERSDIAGASVLVMQDGKVLLEKGYGVADEKTQRPVDATTTIFRLASISKLFTWISVMQLEEQGRLNIDEDVNKYLDFEIRPAFGKPITLRNLMTHTGGFEDELRDMILTDPKQTVSLRDFLVHNQPHRLFAPGTVPAYSNYGVGLAGYIVQRVSGEPFEQYVANHIFAPVGMTHSTFAQPPPKEFAPQPGTRWLPVMTKIAALAWVLPLAVVFSLAAKAGDQIMPPTDAWDKWFIVMDLAMGLAMLLSLFPLLSGIRIWRQDVRRITKVKFTLVAVSCVMLAWFALYFHVLGPIRI